MLICRQTYSQDRRSLRNNLSILSSTIERVRASFEIVQLLHIAAWHLHLEFEECSPGLSVYWFSYGLDREHASSQANPSQGPIPPLARGLEHISDISEAHSQASFKASEGPHRPRSKTLDSTSADPDFSVLLQSGEWRHVQLGARWAALPDGYYRTAAAGGQRLFRL